MGGHSAKPQQKALTQNHKVLHFGGKVLYLHFVFKINFDF